MTCHLVWCYARLCAYSVTKPFYALYPLQINITSEVKATVDRIVSAIKSTAASSTAILDASAVRTALDSLAAAAALADVNSAAGADAGDGASTLSQVVTMHDGESRLMTKEEAALLDIAQAGGVDPRFVRVIDAYKMPAMEYAPSRQTYLPSHRTRSLHGVRRSFALYSNNIDLDT
jgi:hypothetical protein